MENKIGGKELVKRLRRLSKTRNFTFGIIFLTCNLATGKCGETRKYERCQIRPAKRDELSVNPGEHYLFFTDVETSLPKTCFRKLIRQVCFNGSSWHKVNWIDE